MEITEANLAAFKSWLLDRGRAEGTADLYLKNLKRCAQEERITTRLRGGLAPLTKRTNKAALVQWARFTKNPDLAELVEAVKLPPAKRSKPKLPLQTAQWQRFVQHLASSNLARVPLGHVCLVVAKRGLRVSDAIRIKRTEVAAALKTGVLSYVGKGAKRHEISAEPIRAHLEALHAATGWTIVADLVSPTPAGATNRVRRAMRREATHLGIEGVYPHRFRRTYARHYLEEHRGDPRAVLKLQNHMGWSNLNTAMSYADDVDHGELAQTGDQMAKKLFG